MVGTDSTEIHEEWERLCSWSICREQKWQDTKYCLTHYIDHGLTKNGILRPESGPMAARGTGAFRWAKLRDDYVAFFSYRAKALLAGDLIPCRRPMEAVTIAFKLHKEQDTVHGIPITFEHFLSLVEYVWRFDRFIIKRVEK